MSDTIDEIIRFVHKGRLFRFIDVNKKTICFQQHSSLTQGWNTIDLSEISTVFSKTEVDFIGMSITYAANTGRTNSNQAEIFKNILLSELGRNLGFECPESNFDKEPTSITYTMFNVPKTIN